MTHNSAEWVGRAARSWQGGQVVVADSGSVDGTVAAVERLWPTARTVLCGDVGFGTAANRGMKELSADWVAVSNPDVAFVENCSSEMMRAIQEAPPEVAVLAPQLLNADGTIQPSVGRFPTLWSVVRDHWRPRERRKYCFPQPTTKTDIEWATGACLLFRRQAFKAVGGFDEKFFLYGEEVDLQRRMHDAGMKIVFVPEAKVTHFQPNAIREPRPEVQRWAARGQLRHFAKHGGLGTLWGYRLMALLSGRLDADEAMASRKAILARGTGDAERQASPSIARIIED